MNIVGDSGKAKQTNLDRPDRDKYVDIIWNNIEEDKKCELLIFWKGRLVVFKLDGNFENSNEQATYKS